MATRSEGKAGALVPDIQITGFEVEDEYRIAGSATANPQIGCKHRSQDPTELTASLSICIQAQEGSNAEDITDNTAPNQPDEPTVLPLAAINGQGPTPSWIQNTLPNEADNPNLEPKIMGQIRGPKRDGSFIRPLNAPSFLSSLKYAASTVLLLSLNAAAFGLLPMILMFSMLASTWFMGITHTTVLEYYLISSSMLITTLYISLFSLGVSVFGKDICFPLLLRLTIPCIIFHLVTYNIREVYQLQYLSYLYYLCFVFFNCGLLYFVRLERGANSPECANRFEALVSDGTPIAIMKGLIPCVAIYYMSTYYFVPFLLLQESLVVRLLGRIIIMPLIFNMADSYQSNKIIFKSIEHIKFRMIMVNFTHFVYQMILRILTTNSPSLVETALVSFLSMLFDIGLHSTFIPRAMYSRKIYGQLTQFKISLNRKNNKVDSLSNVLQPCESVASTSASSSFRTKDEQGIRTDTPSKRPIYFQAGHIDRIRSIFSWLNEEDDSTKFIIAYRSHRAYFTSISELQMIFSIPMALYLHHKIRDYVTLQTFATIEQALLSLLVQLPFELVTQITCVALENYLYGIEVPVEKFWYRKLTINAMLRTAVISTAVLYLVVNPFWKSIKDWPDA